MSNRRVWTTQYGERIQIRHLEDEHLDNIIRMIERNFNELVSAAWSLYSMLQGEMATYYAEQDIDAMEEEGPSCVSKHYNDLVEEQQRRKLRRQNEQRRV